MSESSVTLRALLDELAQQDRAPRDAARHMHEAISSSPFLTHFITNAVDKGLVKHIRFSPAETNSSGHFEATEKTIYINRQNFDLFLQGDMSAEQLHDRMVSTLAHETSHAFSAYSLLAAQSTLDYQIITEIRAAGSGGRAELTEPVKAYLDVARALEAEAGRAGWNALSTRVVEQDTKQLDVKTFLTRAARTTYCVKGEEDQPKELAAGITLDAKWRIPDTQREAVARCFFDRPTGSLGHELDSGANYRNYYAAYPIQVIAIGMRDRPSGPEIRLDMTRLNLDSDQIQKAGLDFEREGREIYIADSSGGTMSFKHNMSRSTRSAPDAHIGDNRINFEHTDISVSAFSDPTHRDHALYEAVRNSVETQLPPGAEVSEDRLAQFTLAAKAAHFKPDGRIDSLISETGISFHGDYPAHSTRIDLADPVPSADESVQKAANMDREQARQSEQLASRPPPEREQAPVMQH